MLVNPFKLQAGVDDHRERVDRNISSLDNIRFELLNAAGDGILQFRELEGAVVEGLNDALIDRERQCNSGRALGREQLLGMVENGENRYKVL